MAIEVCFDISFINPTDGSVKLEYLTQANALHLQWYGRLSYDDHKRAAEMTYEWISKKGATRWIGDVHRLTEPMTEGIADFIGWEWFPGAVAAGISEKVAVVLPKLEAVTPSTMTIAQRIAEKHPEKLESIEVRPFTDMYEARGWVGEDS